MDVDYTPPTHPAYGCIHYKHDPPCATIHLTHNATIHLTHKLSLFSVLLSLSNPHPPFSGTTYHIASNSMQPSKQVCVCVCTYAYVCMYVYMYLYVGVGVGVGLGVCHTHHARIVSMADVV
jgi:hypothetical protein